MKAIFKLSMEFSDDGAIDIDFIQQSVIEAIERSRAEGCITPNIETHPMFIGAEIELVCA